MLSPRTIKKLELLRPHAASAAYGMLVRRSQSFLITKIQLTTLRQAQPFDVEVALRMGYQSRGSQLRLNEGNPALASEPTPGQQSETGR